MAYRILVSALSPLLGLKGWGLLGFWGFGDLGAGDLGLTIFFVSLQFNYLVLFGNYFLKDM